MEQTYLDALLVVDKQIARRFNYKVELKPADAVEVARTLDGTLVAALIEAVNEVMPGAFYGDGHVGNGRKEHTFEIGLEYGQRVVYVKFVKTYHHDWSRQREAALLDQLDAISEKHEATEFGIWENNVGFHYRFWWGS